MDKMQNIGCAIVLLGMLFVGQWPVFAIKPNQRNTAKALADSLIKAVQDHKPFPQWQKLIGREDVAVELRRALPKLDKKGQKNLLSKALSIGRRNGSKRWEFSSAVTALLVEAAASCDDPSVREYAADLLVEQVPDQYLRVHTSTIIEAVRSGKIGNALLLGKTGAAEAKALLQKGGRLWKVSSHKAELALAKLGDTERAASFVRAFAKAKNASNKAQLAKSLGYIGDAACVLTLARDMRTSIIYDAGGVLKSLRLDIVAALSEVYPEESVLWQCDVQGNKEVDEWYDAVEKWLEGYLGITWQTPRPKPFSSAPRPHPVPLQ